MDVFGRLKQIWQKDKWFILVAAVALVVMGSTLFKCAMIKFINYDEIEHVHSAWYIAQGSQPYVDFFQHHNPLFWYCIAPLLAIWEESAQIIIYLRHIMFWQAAIVLVVCALIAYEVTKCKWTMLYTFVICIAVNTFAERVIEIRPDVPQVLFGLLAVYLLLLYWRTSLWWLLVCSGVTLAVSFLFLQKSIFLFPVFGGLLLWEWHKKRMSFQELVLFVTGFILPIAIFVLYYYLAGMLPDYWKTNYMLNITNRAHFSPWWVLKDDWLRNPLFWVFSLPAVAFAYFDPKKRKTIRTLGWFAISQIVLLLYAPHPYPQYFLMYVAVTSILLGSMLSWFLDRIAAKGWGWVSIGVVLVFYGLAMLWRLQFSVNTHSLERIQYVLDHTTPEETIFDTNASFNVFRKDCHYFWFSEYRGLRIYRKLYGGFEDYDTIALVRKHKPVFVLAAKVDTIPGWQEIEGQYQRSSKFDRLHILKERVRQVENGLDWKKRND
jgi:hypothetical protein